MASRNLYLFLYHSGVAKGRDNQPFRMRDLEAAMTLAFALQRHGFGHPTMIYNYPDAGPGPYPSDLGRFAQDDLIVITTRPPLDDAEVGNRRVVDRSYTALEYALFDALRGTFCTCARPEIVLAPAIASMDDAFKSRRSFLFHQNGGAMLGAYGDPDTQEYTYPKGDERVTAAFLVYVPHAWPGGPGLLVAFGLGGTETLVWAHQLATTYRDLLCTTTFAMAELSAAPIVCRPEDSTFADAWDVRLIGRAPLLPGPAPIVRTRRSA